MIKLQTGNIFVGLNGFFVCDMSKCEICFSSEAKYCCPKCSVKTCSVGCVKIHKETKNCDGIRDKTKFVALKEFDDMKLLQDYNYLLEVQKIAENNALEELKQDLKIPKKGKRNNKRRKMEGNEEDDVNSDQPNYLKRIVSICGKNETKLHLMPPSFSRRKHNQTRFYKDTIIWTVELVVYEEEEKEEKEGKKSVVFLNQVKEAETMEDVLTKAKIPRFEDYYVLMEVYGRPRNAPLFIRVENLKLSLKDVVRGKEVLEFPTFILRKNIDESLLVKENPKKGLVVPKLYLKEIENESSSSSDSSDSDESGEKEEEEEEEGIEKKPKQVDDDGEEEVVNMELMNEDSDSDEELNILLGKKKDISTKAQNDLWF